MKKFCKCSGHEIFDLAHKVILNIKLQKFGEKLIVSITADNICKKVADHILKKYLEKKSESLEFVDHVFIVNCCSS